MIVRRFRAILHASEILAHPSPEAYEWSGEVVDASSYDSLLAVLRRCVMWMEGQFCPEDTSCKNCHDGREVVSAAREYLEDK